MQVNKTHSQFTFTDLHTGAKVDLLINYQIRGYEIKPHLLTRPGKNDFRFAGISLKTFDIPNKMIEGDYRSWPNITGQAAICQLIMQALEFVDTEFFKHDNPRCTTAESLSESLRVKRDEKGSENIQNGQ